MQVQHVVFNLHISDQKMAKNYMKITKSTFWAQISESIWGGRSLRDEFIWLSDFKMAFLTINSNYWLQLEIWNPMAKHLETSQLICSVHELADFYMIWPSVTIGIVCFYFRSSLLTWKICYYGMIVDVLYTNDLDF